MIKMAKPVVFEEGTRVMVFMPQEIMNEGGNRRVSIAIIWTISCTGGTFELPVGATLDRPDNEPTLVSMDHAVKCSEELPETSWLGKTPYQTPGRGKKVSH